MRYVEFNLKGEFKLQRLLAQLLDANIHSLENVIESVKNALTRPRQKQIWRKPRILSIKIEKN